MYEQLPPNFRQEIMQPLLKTLRAGESCSLVGVGSSGKSNVARHLDRFDVRQHYLGDTASRILNLYVNCTKLPVGGYTAHQLYRLILDVLTKTVARDHPGHEALGGRLRSLWKEAITADVPDLSRSNLEEAFAAVFGAGFLQAFVTFDDFDPFVSQAPAASLNALRALRDDFKTRVMYVTVTRRELEFLRPDPRDFEDFLELVAPKTIVVGPYTEADARYMIRRLGARETPPREFAPVEEDRLLELSGRHAGLIRMIYRVAQNQRVSLTAGDLLDRMQNQTDIVEECEKIWDSLEDGERRTLRQLLAHEHPTGQEVRALVQKGIVRDAFTGSYEVVSPFLNAYLAAKLPPRGPAIRLLPERRVQVGERVVTDLDEIEYALLSYLFEQHPQPVNWEPLRQQMVDIEAGQQKVSGPPDRRLDMYLRGLKRKIETDEREYIELHPDGHVQLKGVDG